MHLHGSSYMGKNKGGRLKSHVPNANFLVCVLVCLCQKQSGWESTAKGRKYPVQTRRQTSQIYIPSWFPVIFVDIDQLWKNTNKRPVSLISSFFLPVGTSIILHFQQTPLSFTAE